MTREVKIGKIKIGGDNPLVLIAGPCVIENEQSCFSHARRIKEICASVKVPFIFKSSYDKANRSSLKSFRGIGLKAGLGILGRIKEELNIPVLTDVHSAEEAEEAGNVVDVIQIPAFLCRQTDILLSAGNTGKAVNIKKGQFLAPLDMRHAVKKVESTGNRNIILTERGTFFGYGNLVSDMRALPVMRSLGYPVVYDATHSVQQPGGAGNASGGERAFVPGLCRAAAAMGVDGIFLEVHHNPDNAPCDGPNMLPLKGLKPLLNLLKKLNNTIAGYDEKR
ncbi:MAG: 3-deoxy-8-phosphooctulonate synthase [Candidatus Omnitrophica bacterium]|nr:3-deoxy-8-phosphooctulonate synthase [Candidatus Omnitrophota bacterium]